jgi:hypothetical protein
MPKSPKSPGGLLKLEMWIDLEHILSALIAGWDGSWRATAECRSKAAEWIDALLHGSGRMPKTMPPDRALRLLSALLGELGPCHDFLVACVACGLPRPLSAGRAVWFPEGCPSCGEQEWMWTTRTRDEPQPWHELADGWMPHPSF